MEITRKRLHETKVRGIGDRRLCEEQQQPFWCRVKHKIFSGMQQRHFNHEKDLPVKNIEAETSTPGKDGQQTTSATLKSAKICCFLLHNQVQESCAPFAHPCKCIFSLMYLLDIESAGMVVSR